MAKKAKNLKAESYSLFYRLASNNPDVELIMDALEDNHLEGGPIPYRLSDNSKSGVVEIYIDSTRLEDARKFIY